jgi:hypothetical protein
VLRLNFTRHLFSLAIRRPKPVILVVLVLNLFSGLDCLAQSAGNLESFRPRRVLMLFREARDRPGSIMLEQSIRAAMQKAGTNRIEFLTENLDASHFSDQTHFHMFEDYLGKKYAGEKIDLILAFSSGDYWLAEEFPSSQRARPRMPWLRCSLRSWVVLPCAISTWKLA